MSGADAAVAAALPRFGFTAAADVALVNVSENRTYRVEEDGRRAAVRVARPGYHSADELASELLWIDALRAEGVVDAPAALRADDGERVIAAAGSHVVAFEWLDGVMPGPDGDGLVTRFRLLGGISAALHVHARRWRPPAGFTRPRWDHETMLGPRAAWGRWQDGLGIGREEHALLGRLDATLARRLGAFGRTPDRFGLVHADLRLANLLLHGDRVRVLDFDDSGFSWFLYDFATAVSFMEDHPALPELKAAWLAGYREVVPLSAAEEAEIDTFVLLRRLLLVAWVGSHQDAPEAQALGAAFTDGTCALAESYLSVTPEV